MSVTAAQLRAIHAAARAAGLDDDAYRDRLRAVAGVSSAKDLSRSEASAVLADLGLPRPPRRRSPSRAPRPRKLPAGVPRLMTPAQRRLIDELVAEVRWDGPDGDEEYRRWVRGSLRMRAIQTSADARAVIEGLKGLKRSRPR